MPFRTLRIIVLAVLTLVTAACSDDEPRAGAGTASEGNVQWISTGGPCDDLEMVQNDKDSKENLGFVFCGNAGRSFTGDLRCERDYIEVKCR